MNPTLDKFFAVLEAYMDARRLSESRVSTLVFGAGHRILLVRKGGDIGARKVDAALRWFSANWPDGAEWPAGVERPMLVSGEVPSVDAEDLPSVASTQHLV